VRDRAKVTINHYIGSHTRVSIDTESNDLE